MEQGTQVIERYEDGTGLEAGLEKLEAKPAAHTHCRADDAAAKTVVVPTPHGTQRASVLPRNVPRGHG